MWSILLGLVHLSYIIYMCGPSIPFGTSHPIRVKNPLWVRILVSYTIYRGSLLSLMYHTVIQNKSNLPIRLSEVRWEESRRLPFVFFVFFSGYCTCAIIDSGLSSTRLFILMHTIRYLIIFTYNAYSGIRAYHIVA